jgi:hypothetical protein
MPITERTTKRLWIWGRVANIILGTVLTLAGMRLFFVGGAGWCPFQLMPEVLTSIIGGGFFIGGLLLFAAKTAPLVLPCLTSGPCSGPGLHRVSLRTGVTRPAGWPRL